MTAIEWDGLLAKAEAQWQDFLTVLADRAPEDDRLASLRTAKAEPVVNGG